MANYTDIEMLETQFSTDLEMTDNINPEFATALNKAIVALQTVKKFY